MPAEGSVVEIRYDGTDITNKVLYRTARFESQMAAVPGTFEFTVKDTAQTLAFVSGKEITIDLDGTRIYGGYVTQARRVFAFPADKVINPATVRTRQWILSGVDYNIMFDKRVLRNPSNYLEHLPFFTLDRTIGELLREEIFAKYWDTPPGFNTTTYVDDCMVPHFDINGNPDPDASLTGGFKQQGTKVREQMDQFAQYGAVYYVDPSKNVHLHEVEDTAAAWGFSDKPNKMALPSTGLATYGFREFEFIENIEGMGNDALVWGGSEWAGSGTTVFARRQNTDSIDDHLRLQVAETHFGETGFKTQAGVNARANVLISGNTTGTDINGVQRGASVPQYQIRLAWFGHDVPEQGGNRVHIRPPQVVTFIVYTMGSDASHPLVMALPCRQVRISFPLLDKNGRGHVRFDGFFGISLSDPYWLWKFLRERNRAQQATPTVATATNTTAVPSYGAVGQFFPAEDPDGSRTAFTLPQPYIGGTTQVYVNGLLQQVGVSYTESSPTTGQITLLWAPEADDEIWVICRVAASGG